MEKLPKSGDGKEKLKKAGAPVAMLFAGMLAGSALESGKNDSPGFAYDSPQMETVASDYSTSYEAPTEQYAVSNYDSFNVPASKEATQAIGTLDQSLSDSGPTPEQIAQVKSMVDAYVAQHPVQIGKTVESPDGKEVYSESSYDPLLDLGDAAIKQPNINALTLGLLLKELSARKQQ